MLTNLEVPVKWQGRTYVGIDRLGFNENEVFIVALWTTPPGTPRGSYFTSLPISDKRYRRTVHTTKTKVVDGGKWIEIFDDWGVSHKIEANKEVLRILLRECDENEIPRCPNEDVGR